MAAVESPVPAAVTESKSARKKKAKAEAAAAANGTDHSAPAVPEMASKDNSAIAEADSTAEHPYIKELQKQIRNINKKLTAMHKLDAILAENPNVSLDDLVSQRKINADQKAAAQKKPQLVAQLADLEERQEHYRKFDSDYQVKFNKQRDELALQHQQQLDKLKEEMRFEAISASSTELRNKLLIFSQFLQAAAAKRGLEEAQDTEESQAFEGALLLVYGGDQKAVETAVNLIEGTELPVPSVEGILTSVTFKQVKQAALDHAPYQAEEAWVDQVAEATSGEAPAAPDTPLPTSDPTLTHAGMTEIDALAHPVSTENIVEPASAPPVSAGDAGNVAGERWDTNAAGAGAGAEKSGLDDSYEIVPRPSEEVDIPVETSAAAGVSVQPQSTSWADEPTQEAATGVGNHAGEKWDTKAPGEADNSWVAAEPTPSNGAHAEASSVPLVNDDGFSQVPGRHRGRGGNRGGRGGDGEGRGRGRGRGNFRGGRGDGEFRGGRGGGYRGNRGDGEFRAGRGGGGRGRGGNRGGGDAGTSS